MKNSFLVLCENCCNFFNYTTNSSNRCSKCGLVVTIDKGVEDLVFALNSLGVVTIGSCEGHSNNCSLSFRNYPWVAVSNDKRVVEKATELVEEYNLEDCNRLREKWKVEVQKTSLGWRWFVVPVKKEIIKIDNKRVIFFVNFLKRKLKAFKRE